MKKDSKSKVQKTRTDKTLRRAVHRAVAQKKDKLFQAPKHHCSGACGDMDLDRATDPSVPNVNVDITADAARGLLVVGHLITAMDIARTNLEIARKHVKTLYSTEDNVPLKLDTLIGQVLDIRRTLAPKLRRYIGQQMAKVSTQKTTTIVRCSEKTETIG